MSESELKSLLAFGTHSGRSYGTVDKRYLGTNNVTTDFIAYTTAERKYILVVPISISQLPLQKYNSY